jgi:hypothetical protein
MVSFNRIGFHLKQVGVFNNDNEATHKEGSSRSFCPLSHFILNADGIR